jgi:quinol monooxygenase YgiN
MRRQPSWVVILAGALAGGGHAVSARADDTVTVVTYIEAVPSAASRVRDLLAAHAKESRRAKGNLEYQPLQRVERPNHFAVLESWRDAAAMEAYARSAAAERFGEALAPLVNSPPDRRTHHALAAGPHRADGRGAIYVLTHIDVIPTSLPQVVENLRALAAASRSEAANLRFDVLVTERPNHMTVVEEWADAAAQRAHLGEPHNRAFRMQLAPDQGALYDERLYRGF